MFAVLVDYGQSALQRTSLLALSGSLFPGFLTSTFYEGLNLSAQSVPCAPQAASPGSLLETNDTNDIYL